LTDSLIAPRCHIQAGVMVARPWPFETLVMAVLLEQQKQVEEMIKIREEFMASKE
jgi:hypothetical protein